MRKSLFLATEAKIRDHNLNSDLGFTIGHNFFSDMTDEERRMRLGLNPFAQPHHGIEEEEWSEVEAESF